MVPLRYRDHLNNLMTNLPPEGVNLFINFFTDIFNYLSTTLPEEFTTLSSQNSVLLPYVLTMIKEFIDTLNTAQSYLLTIMHFNLPSPNNRPLYSDILDDLHSKLYTNMDNDIPRRLTTLRTALQPMLLGHASSELEAMLDHLVHELISDLNSRDWAIWEELCIQPQPPPTDPYWYLTEFFDSFDIERFSQRLGIDPGHTPDAQDCDMDELSIVYVHQARTDAETDVDNCAVCLEVMKDGNNARRLRCLHAFHVDCIDHWLEMNDICPMCRTHINATHEIESTLNGA